MIFDHAHDVALAAWAQSCDGPGWANTPVLVLIRDRRDGKLRIEYLQPDEQTAEMREVYAFSNLASGRMLGAAERLFAEKKNRARKRGSR